MRQQSTFQHHLALCGVLAILVATLNNVDAYRVGMRSASDVVLSSVQQTVSGLWR